MKQYTKVLLCDIGCSFTVLYIYKFQYTVLCVLCHVPFWAWAVLSPVPFCACAIMLWAVLSVGRYVMCRFVCIRTQRLWKSWSVHIWQYRFLEKWCSYVHTAGLEQNIYSVGTSTYCMYSSNYSKVHWKTYIGCYSYDAVTVHDVLYSTYAK